MKWKLYDKYNAQNKEMMNFTRKYEQKVQESKENITTATLAYEDLLKREFSGEEVSKEKQKALDNINKAQTALKVAEEERSKAYTYAHKNLSNITIEDLAKDWLYNIRPTLREERLTPIVQQAEEALHAYYSAIQDLIQLNNECAALASGVLRKAGQVYIPIGELGDLPKHPTDSDWYNILRYGKVPARYRN
ncbi:hypothetical protein [Bacillus cereus]|uniref:hypothetical protein n=1 Tax=Bacillus cereus TaxID=1396 RepID=UPI0020D27340|nr:hypothetical protein [Bacillus cereus]